MNTVMLLASIVILFVGFIFALLVAEKLDSKEKDSKKEKTLQHLNIFYPTKCEKCKKLDKFVTRSNMRFCNSCHADYIMID